jgi:ABC-type dipeptide/oligopeptide/nickel transport system permease subunit
MNERLTEMALKIRQVPTVVVGMAIVLVLIFTAVFAPYISPYEATTFNPKHRFEAPSRQFWLGTDQFGRDLFSRIVMGSRVSLTIGITATLGGAFMGTLLGLFSGYTGGRTDEFIMRLLDALMSFPGLLLALLILTALGSSLVNVIISISIYATPRVARVARSVTLAAKNEEYVLAAQARGDNIFYILFAEILPNVVPPIIVESSIRVGFAILMAASISFLGMGTQPPTPDWGLMIGQAREYIFKSAWIILWPAVAIAVTVVGFNLLGDGLRDVLDPYLTRKSGRDS